MIDEEIKKAMEEIKSARFMMPDADELLEIAENSLMTGSKDINTVDALTDAFYLGFYRGMHYRK